jgi:hypothetical protein
VPLSHVDRGRLGGLRTQAAKTPDQRREATRKARLALAVKELVDQAPALSADQLVRLRAILTTEAPGGET